MMIDRWLLVLLISIVVGCERTAGPVARPVTAIAPGIEVEGRRFDPLEWPLTQRRIELPEAGILEKFARFLRFPKESSHRITGIEIRDSTAWNALWATVAPGDSVHPPVPFVDFSHEMVYVVVAEQPDDFLLERIAITHVYLVERRYSVYTTTRNAVTPTRAPAQMMDAIILPTVDLGVTLFVFSDPSASERRAPAR